jgi:hypothetical protein
MRPTDHGAVVYKQQLTRDWDGYKIGYCSSVYHDRRIVITGYDLFHQALTVFRSLPPESASYDRHSKVWAVHRDHSDAVRDGLTEIGFSVQRPRVHDKRALAAFDLARNLASDKKIGTTF